jgi:hypothetical protein
VVESGDEERRVVFLLSFAVFRPLLAVLRRLFAG